MPSCNVGISFSASTVVNSVKQDHVSVLGLLASGSLGLADSPGRSGVISAGMVGADGIEVALAV